LYEMAREFEIRSNMLEGWMRKSGEYGGEAFPGSGRLKPGDEQLRRLQLERHQVALSVSRKGDCWEIAVVESFFATLKSEPGDTLSTRKAARVALFD